MIFSGLTIVRRVSIRWRPGCWTSSAGRQSARTIHFITATFHRSVHSRASGSKFCFPASFNGNALDPHRLVRRQAREDRCALGASHDTRFCSRRPRRAFGRRRNWRFRDATSSRRIKPSKSCSKAAENLSSRWPASGAQFVPRRWRGNNQPLRHIA